MENIKPYNKYKPSLIDGLGDIPEHWERWKLNRVLFFQEGPGLRTWQFKDSGVKVICVTNITPPIISFAKMTKYISVEEYEEKYKHFTVEKGNILLASSGATWGKVSTYNDDEKVILNTSTIRLNTKKNEMLSNSIVKHLLNANYVNTQLQNLLTGSCQPNFGPTHLNKLYVALPPLEEQTIIENFLDYKLAKIDRFIRKKKQLIKLLNEQKTGIINYAVTKGLDPKANLKPSGIEWLGEIPEHWEVRKLKYLVSKTGSGVTPKGGSEVYKDEGIPFLRSQNIHFDGLKIDNVAFISNEVHSTMSNTALMVGDVLLNITGASIGRCCFVPNDFKEGNVNQHVCIIRPKNLILTKYLTSILSSSYLQDLIQFEQVGASREALNQDEIKNLPIILPTILEQEKIVSYIEKETSIINKTISNIRREIALTQEYRTVLIAEAVTGKIDVRSYVIPALEEEILYEELEEELDMVVEEGEEIEID
ncbi:restriction endonuclease subunit S [Flavobacterium psychrophilum]